MYGSQLKPVVPFKMYNLSNFYVLCCAKLSMHCPPPPSSSVGRAGSQRHCSFLIFLETDDSLMQASVTKTKVAVQFTWYRSKLSFLDTALFPDLTRVCPSLTSSPLQGCAGWLHSWTAKSPTESRSQCLLVPCIPLLSLSNRSRLTEVLAESCHHTARDATSSLVLWIARDVRSYCSVSSSSCFTFLLSL